MSSSVSFLLSEFESFHFSMSSSGGGDDGDDKDDEDDDDDCGDSCDDPVDCLVSDWEPQGGCDELSGTQTMVREVVVEPDNDGGPCPPLVEEVPCLVDCTMSEWSEWGECDLTTGMQTRTRAHLFGPHNGGAPCGPAEEVVPCDDPCIGHTCANGGTCQAVDFVVAECDCALNYDPSTNCFEPIDFCIGNMCSAPGLDQCISNFDTGDYTCQCVEGYNGDFCEHMSEFCFPSPCANGFCSDIEAEPYFMCACDQGYEGDLCDTVVDYCATDTGVPGTGNPSSNGACDSGTCVNDATGEEPYYMCECFPGYSGELCTYELDFCSTDNGDGNPNVGNPSLSGPCENGGQCSSEIYTEPIGFTCDCAFGFEGETCGDAIDFCAMGLCLNNADCDIDLDSDSGVLCSCQEGYAGEFCGECSETIFNGVTPEAAGFSGNTVLTVAFVGFPVNDNIVVNIDGLGDIIVNNMEYNFGLGGGFELAVPPCVIENGCQLGNHVMTITNPCSGELTTYSLVIYDDTPRPTVLNTVPTSAYMQVETRVTITVDDIPLPDSIDSGELVVLFADFPGTLVSVSKVTELSGSFVVTTPIMTIVPGVYICVVNSYVSGELVSATFPFVFETNVIPPAISIFLPSSGETGDTVFILVTNLDYESGTPVEGDVSVTFGGVAATLVSGTFSASSATSASFEVTVPAVGEADAIVDLAVAFSGASPIVAVQFSYIAPLIPSLIYTSAVGALDIGGDTLILRVGTWDQATVPASSLSVFIGDFEVLKADVKIVWFTFNTYQLTVLLPPGVAGDLLDIQLVFSHGLTLSFYESFGEYFEIISSTAPYLGPVYPVVGETTGGAPLVAEIMNFDPAVAADLTLNFVFGTTVIPITTYAYTMSAVSGRLTFTSPVVTVPGVYEVQIKWDFTGEAYSLKYKFTYSLPPNPEVVLTLPDFGPHTGENSVMVTINHFPVVLFPSFVKAVVDGVDATVTRIVSSAKFSTTFYMTLPSMSSNFGAVTAEYYAKVGGEFVWKASGVYNTYDANAPLITSATPSAYFDVGGTKITVTINNFPRDGEPLTSVDLIDVFIGGGSCYNLAIFNSYPIGDGTKAFTTLTCVLPFMIADATGGALMEIGDLGDFSGEDPPTYAFTVWPSPTGSLLVSDFSPKVAPTKEKTTLTLTVNNLGAVALVSEVTVLITLADSSVMPCAVTGFAVFQPFAKVFCTWDLSYTTVAQRVQGVVYKTVKGPATAAGFIMEIVSLYDPQVAYFYPAAGSEVGGTGVTVSLLYFPKFPSAAQMEIMITVGGVTQQVPSTGIKILSSYTDSTLVTFTTVEFPGGGSGTCVITLLDANLVSTGKSASLAFTFNPLPTGPATDVYFLPSAYNGAGVTFETPTIGGVWMKAQLFSDFFVKEAADLVVQFRLEGASDAEAVVVPAADVVMKKIGVFTNVDFTTPAVEPEGNYFLEIYPSDRVANRYTKSTTVFVISPGVEFLYPATSQPGETITVGMINYWIPTDATVTCTLRDPDGVVADVDLGFESFGITSEALGKFTVTFMLPNVADLLEGYKTLVIATSDGQVFEADGDAATAEDNFWYIPAASPALQYILPTSGVTYGGETVTLAMVNFVAEGDVTVFFGDVRAAGVVANQYGTLLIVNCLSPRAVAGMVSGNVTEPISGTAIRFNFEYVVPATPTFSLISPAVGPSTGGTLLLLKLLDIPDALSADQIVVKFDTTFLPVDVFSQVGDTTTVSVTTPTYPGAAFATIQVYRSDVSYVKAVGVYEYFDASTPLLTVGPEPSLGISTGGALVYAEFQNIAVVASPTELSCFCGKESGTVQQLLESSASILKVVMKMPANTAGLKTCGLYRTAAGIAKAASFSFLYTSPIAPVLEYANPVSGSVLGGTAIRIDVSRFPVVTSPSDIAVFFGFQDVAPFLLEASNSLNTAFYVRTPEWTDLETVSVLVAPAADATLSATFEYTFTAPIIPTYSYVSATSGVVDGGEQLTVVINDFPLVSAVTDVVALFGVEKGVIVEVVSSSDVSTTLIVETPVSSTDGWVEMLFYAKRTGPALAATTDINYQMMQFLFISTNPILGYVFPQEGTSNGGTVMTVFCTNVLSEPTSYSVTVAGLAADAGSFTATYLEGTFTIIVTTPEYAAVASGGESVEVVVDIDGKTSTGSFYYLDANLPFISFMYPTTGPNTGGTQISLSVTSLSEGLSQPSDVTVFFGTTQADILSVSQPTGVSNPVTEIVLKSPAYGAFGYRDVKVLEAGDTDLDNAPTAMFEYFTTCDFDTYCFDTLNGREADYDAMYNSPPADSSCSVTYCAAEPLPDPFVFTSSPSYVSDAGGDVFSITIAYLPLAVVSDFRITLNGVAASGIVVKKSVAEETIVTAVMPQMASTGLFEVAVMHLGVTPVVSRSVWVECYPEPVGLPVLRSFYPLNTTTTVVTAAFATFTNSPLLSDVASVKVKIGTRDMVVTNVESNVDATTVYYEIKSGLCDVTCDAKVKFNILSRKGVWSGDVYVDMVLIAPYLYPVRVYPGTGASSGGDVIGVTLGDASTDVREDFTFSVVEDATAVVSISDSFASGQFSSGTDVKMDIVMPAMPAGDYTIMVENSGQMTYFPFNYYPVGNPQVTFVSPVQVDATGGTIVTVYASNMELSGLSITGCDSADLTSTFTTVFDNGADGFGITLTSGACALGPYSINLSNGATSLDVAVVSVIPTSYTMEGLMYAARPNFVSIMAWQFTDSTDVSNIRVSVGGDETGVITGVTLPGANGWNTVSFTSPSITILEPNTVVWVELWRTDDATTRRGYWQVFTFYPVISYISPTEDYVTGGAEMVIVIDYFPKGMSMTDMDVRFRETQVILTGLVNGETSSSLFLTVPPSADTGLMTMWIGVIGMSPEDGGLFPKFTYKALPPVLSSYAPLRAGMSGGDLLEVVINNLGVVETADEVVAGTATRSWAVDSIVYSDSVSTKFVVVTPSVLEPGPVVLEVGNKFQTIFFDFVFYDDRIVLLEPQDGVIIVGPEVGGTVIDVVIENFPTVTGPSDVICKFGTEFALVNSASTVTANGVSTTTFEVVSPPYLALAYTTGLATVEVSLFLLAAPENVVYFDHTYRSPMRATSAQFEAAYSWINVKMNQPTIQGTAGSSVNCATVLPESMYAGVGYSASDTEKNCLWPSPDVLRILFLNGATLKPGMNLELIAGSMQGLDDEEGITFLVANGDSTTTHSVEIIDDPIAADPVAIVAGPSEIGFCDPLVASASGSSGTRLSYSWGCRNDDTLDQVLFSAIGAEIYVPLSALTQVDFTYELTMSVTDFTGRKSAQQVLYVNRASLALPNIIILGSSSVFPLQDESAFVIAGADFSGCAVPQQLTFEWTQVIYGSEPTLDFAALGIVANGANLYIPPGVLDGGISFYFRVYGYPAEDPLNRGSADLMVSVQLPPLIVSIVGGDRTVSNTNALVVDASESYDPSGAKTVADFAFLWSCYEWDPVGYAWQACRDVNEAVLATPTTSSISFEAGLMKPGLYSFAVYVTAFPRGAYAFAYVTVVEESIPEAFIYRDATIMVTRASGMVNSDDKVALGTTVSGVSGTTALTYEWSLSPSDGIDLADPLVAPMGLNSWSFALNPFVLEAGRTYTAIVTVNNGGSIGEASHTIIVNNPPTPGTCAITPKTGFALQTPFSIACAGWKDDSTEAVTYAFSAWDGSGELSDAKLLMPAGPDNTLSGFTLSAGTTSTSEVIVFYEVFDNDGASRLLVEVITVVDPLATASPEEVADAMSLLADAQLQELLQKGDSTAAFNSVGDLAGTAAAASSTTSARRRRRRLSPEAAEARRIRFLTETNLGCKLLDGYIAAMDGAVVTMENIESTISSLASAAALADPDWDYAYLTSGFEQFMALLPTLDGQKLGVPVGTLFMNALDSMMSAMSNKFIPAASSETDKENMGSVMFANVNQGMTPVISAVLANLMMNEPMATVPSGDAAAAGTVTAVSVRQVTPTTMLAAPTVTPSGASYLMPAEIEGLLRAEGIFVAAASFPDPWYRTGVEFAARVHGMYLLDPTAEVLVNGMYAISDLTEPVKVTIPIVGTFDFVNGERMPQCSYFSDMVWTTDTTCEVDSYDNTEVVCNCNHLPNFLTLTTTEKPPDTVSSTKTVIDDYMVGCVIFNDCDGDGVLDADESQCLTTSTGSCALEETEGQTCQVTYLWESQAASCLDRSTNLAVELDLKSNGDVTSILTTLDVNLQENEGLSASASLARMETSFSSVGGCDPSSCDPVAAVEAAGAASASSEMSSLGDISTVTAVLGHAVALLTGKEQTAAVNALTTMLKTGSAVDLTSSDTTLALFTAAASNAGKVVDATLLAAASQASAASAARIKAAISAAITANSAGAAALTSLGEQSTSAQTVVGGAIGDLATGVISLADFEDATGTTVVLPPTDDGGTDDGGGDDGGGDDGGVDDIPPTDDGADDGGGAAAGGGGAGAAIGGAVGGVVGLAIFVIVFKKMSKKAARTQAVTVPASVPQSGPPGEE